MNLIDVFIEDYNAGRISESTLSRRLAFVDYAETAKQNRHDIAVGRKIKDYIDYSLSEPDIILERQQQYKDIAIILEEIKKLLTASQHKVFMMRYLQGHSQEYIAKRLGLTQQAVSSLALRAVRRVKEWFHNSNLVEALRPAISRQVVTAPKHKVRYPAEHLSKIYTGGRAGKRVWINHTKCVMLVYLDEAFGDNKTTCAYCEKCRNRKMKARINK